MEKKSIEVGCLLVFPIFFWRRLLLMSCSRVFIYLLQRMARNTFLACKLIVHALSLVVSDCNFTDKKKVMAMSKDEMEKEHDYQMREKVALEEEGLWVKLCSKLVSVYIKIIKKS